MIKYNSSKSLNQTLNQLLNTTYLCQYRLGKERYAIDQAHLSMPAECILGASLSRTSNITTKNIVRGLREI